MEKRIDLRVERILSRKKKIIIRMTFYPPSYLQVDSTCSQSSDIAWKHRVPKLQGEESS